MILCVNKLLYIMYIGERVFPDLGLSWRYDTQFHNLCRFFFFVCAYVGGDIMFVYYNILPERRLRSRHKHR